MRLSALLTLLCTLAALVLSLLCLLAGSSRSFLQNAELFTLNISRIGYVQVFNTSDGGTPLADWLNQYEDRVNNLIGNAGVDIANTLNLSDYYSIHVMTYCEGNYEPNATARNPSDNTTWCSSRSALFNFNATADIEEKLPAGITLQDIGWPSDMDDYSSLIRTASRAMFACYIVGIVFAGLGVLGAFLTLFTNGRLSPFMCFVIDLIGFLAIGVASGFATAIIVRAVNAINQYGNSAGIAAYRGVIFLGMTWGATAAMLLAATLSLGQCCVGHRERRSKRRQKEEFPVTHDYPKAGQ